MRGVRIEDDQRNLGRPKNPETTGKLRRIQAVLKGLNSARCDIRVAGKYTQLMSHALSG